MATETVLDVVELMESFGSRHWMHAEGQAVREFASRVKRAYQNDRENLAKAIESLKRELAEAKGEKINDIKKDGRLCPQYNTERKEG